MYNIMCFKLLLFNPISFRFQNGQDSTMFKEYF